MKVSGKLPCLEIDLSDVKLIKVLKIAESIAGKPSAPQSSKIKEMGHSMAVDEVGNIFISTSTQGGVQDMSDQDAENIAKIPQDRERDEFRKPQADVFNAVVVDLAFEISKFLVQESKEASDRSVTSVFLRTSRENLFSCIPPTCPVG